MTTTHLPSPLTGAPLPSVRRLHDLMLELGCAVRDGWCSTHNASLRVHDGGRVACASAWTVAYASPAEVVDEVPARSPGHALPRTAVGSVRL